MRQVLKRVLPQVFIFLLHWTTWQAAGLGGQFVLISEDYYEDFLYFVADDGTVLYSTEIPEAAMSVAKSLFFQPVDHNKYKAINGLSVARKLAPGTCHLDATSARLKRAAELHLLDDAPFLDECFRGEYAEERW